jgi:hypothetical protein
LPTISECLNIFYCQLHNKRALVSPPAIAVDAADELLTITVNLDERLMAAVAVHRVRLYFGPSFLSLPDSLM